MSAIVNPIGSSTVAKPRRLFLLSARQETSLNFGLGGSAVGSGLAVRGLKIGSARRS
jgi:hypothetical protein